MSWLAYLLIILASIFALYQIVSLILQIVKRKKQKHNVVTTDSSEDHT